MIVDRVKSLLERCGTPDTVLPPTDLYNEGWMLRLVLDWLHRNRHKNDGICLPFPDGAEWYSEALLPSAFFARSQGDKLAESRTHADGVIGDFSIGDNGKGDLALRTDARCFVVVEAKMFSKLSPGVTNARYYNQAARNVACIAELVGLAGLLPDDFGTLGFFVVAPQSQIEDGIFSEYMTRDSIMETVARRVAEYGGEKDDWRDRRFIPVAKRASIKTVSWEEIISGISGLDAPFGAELEAFYANCLRFNRAASQWGRS
jgi:hypothetical protein